MSWHCSQALVEEFSALNLLETESCVRLKLTRTAERSYFDGRKKGSSKRSQSGTMLEHSTAERGVERWMSLLEAFPASHSQLPDNKREKQTSGICGPIPFASLEKSDQNGHSWRTSQLCLLADTLEPYSETWPRAAMMRDGKCYRQPKLELPISEIGSGYLPTPTAMDTIHMEIPHDKRSPTLVKAVDRYPTPMAQDAKGKGNSPSQQDKNELAVIVTTGESGSGQLNPDWVAWLMGWPIGWEALKPFEWGNWPSDDWWSVDPADIPSDLEQDITVPMPPKNKYKVELNIKNWPSPRAQDGPHGPARDSLGDVVRWPSPRAGNPGSRPNMKGGKILAEEAKKTTSLGTIPRVATGIPNRVDRLKALGNGQVPLCVKVAWEILRKEVI